MTSIPLKLINELLRTIYSNHTFYCHNLAGYDIIFILKILNDYNEANPNDKYQISCLMRKENILKITIKKNAKKLTILDSYVMLNSSLSDLCKSFDTNKGNFSL